MTLTRGLFPTPLIAAAGAMLLSCSNDTVAPHGNAGPADYEATVQSFNGRYECICGSGRDDVYALGSLRLHYDGAQWSPIPPPPPMHTNFLTDAVSFPNGELFVSGGRDFIRYKDGSWATLASTPEWVSSLWGSAPDNIYAVSYPHIMHYDGNEWTTLDVPGEQFYDISGISADNIVACGQGITRYDGNEWTTVLVDSFTHYTSIAITESGRTFASSASGIYEIDSSTATLILDRDDNIYYPRLSADGDILYAVAGTLNTAEQYSIKRYENDVWHDIGTVNGIFWDIWSGDGEVFSTGSDAHLWHGTANGGELEHIYPSRGRLFDAVAVDDAIYAIGDHAFRYRDNSWTDLDKDLVTLQTAYGIHGRRSNDIYAVGDQMILHYDGESWSWVNDALGKRLRSVWTSSRNDVVAVGDGPSIIEYDGHSWSELVLPAEHNYSFRAVCGAGELLVAVGDRGIIAMRRDGEWRLTGAPTDVNLTDVWGSDEKHIYALTLSQIYFFDGRHWRAMYINGAPFYDLTSIWGTSQSDIYVLGHSGAVAHLNGNSWERLPRLIDFMSSISGVRGEILVCGSTGALTYRR